MRRTWTLAVVVAANGRTDSIIAEIARAMGRVESAEPMRPSKNCKVRRTRLEWDWSNSIVASQAMARLRHLREQKHWQSLMSEPRLQVWWRDEN